MTTKKTDTSKPTRKDLDAKAMAGVDAHLASAGTMSIGGESFTPPALKAVFQADIDASNESDAANTTWRQKVKAANAARVRAAAVRKALKAFLIEQFGPGALQILEDFGFAVPKPPGPHTAKTKAEAAAKAQGTRQRKKAALATA
jgi:hypothetical protein